MPETGLGNNLLAAEGSAARFALADMLHDRRLTLVGIVLLAALMAPPFVLHSLRVGLVETWARDLARDIRNREIVIVGENKIAPGDLATISDWPQTGFVVPEPSFFVSTQRVRKADTRGVSIDLNLRTSAFGDPVMQGFAETPLEPLDIVLSARAAERLGVVPGDRVTVFLARTPSGGEPVRQAVDMTIRRVLPAQRWADTSGFVSPETLLGFRDWLSFVTDDPLDAGQPAQAVWQSLRIYAPTVAEAPALRDRLDAFGFETRLMTDQVDRILKLETGLRSIFRIVLALSATAFVITAFLLQWIGVMRKKRDFALMTVFGMTRAQIMVFPVTQGVLMAAVAGLLALALVAGMQAPVATIVQGYLSTPATVQTPAFPPLVGGLAVAMLIGAGAGMAAIRMLTADDLSQALRGD